MVRRKHRSLKDRACLGVAWVTGAAEAAERKERWPREHSLPTFCQVKCFHLGSTEESFEEGRLGLSFEGAPSLSLCLRFLESMMMLLVVMERTTV